MDVKTLCLGLLTFGEASGYDLKKTFESSLGHFYAAGFGSIYPALASLADAGHVTCEEVPQDGRPDRKVYRITEAGRAHFAAQLAHTEPRHKIRSEFLAMLYFAHFMEAEHVDRILDHRVEELRRLMADIEACPEAQGEEVPPGVQFVVGFGETIVRTTLEYIEKNRSMLTRSVARAEEAARKAS
jgi:DNA-binding PadR family transcriptional regulator